MYNDGNDPIIHYCINICLYEHTTIFKNFLIKLAAQIC